MTIFAGAFSLAGSDEDFDQIGARFAALLSRNADDRPRVLRRPHLVVATVDLGLFSSSSLLERDDSGFSYVSGDPLLRSRAEASLADDLAALHAGWDASEVSALRRTRGSFALLQYAAARQELHLCVDALALRPLYLCFRRDRVYFATALRVLESVAFITRSLDRRGMLESCALGFPLANRTPYEAIEYCEAGASIRLSREHGVRRRSLADWSTIAPRREAEVAVPLLDALRQAVRWRLGREQRALSFLSGGLDSRCVTALLVEAGVQVDTVNIAPQGSLDLELGRAAAHHLGTAHHEFTEGNSDWSARMVHAAHRWGCADGTGGGGEVRGIWTGNGGSVAVGGVYLDDELLATMRQGRHADAARAFLRRSNLGLSPRAFACEWRALAREVLVAGIVDEIRQLPSEDEGRRLHLFLMLNDQRRHMVDAFENIDRYRVEMLNPFFDTAFLRVAMSVPLDRLVAHRFYNDWLKLFPGRVDQVAWQAYPGHQPCPLTLPQGLRNQWADGMYSDEDERRFRRSLLTESASALHSARFPSHILNRPALMAAWWATRLGLGDYQHVMTTLTRVCAQWAKIDAQPV
jgi:hypothetical protein